MLCWSCTLLAGIKLLVCLQCLLVECVFDCYAVSCRYSLYVSTPRTCVVGLFPALFWCHGCMWMWLRHPPQAKPRPACWGL